MKKIINYLKKYFTVWWIPIAFYFLAVATFFIGMLFKKNWIIDTSLTMFFINILGTIISSIVQIITRKWFYIIPQLGITYLLLDYTLTILIFSLPGNLQLLY